MPQNFASENQTARTQWPWDATESVQVGGADEHYEGRRDRIAWPEALHEKEKIVGVNEKKSVVCDPPPPPPTHGKVKIAAMQETTSSGHDP